MERLALLLVRLSNYREAQAQLVTLHRNRLLPLPALLDALLALPKKGHVINDLAALVAGAAVTATEGAAVQSRAGLVVGVLASLVETQAEADELLAPYVAMLQSAHPAVQVRFVS